MQKSKLRFLWVLLGLMLPTAWCMADASISIDGHHPIQIKETNVQSAPKGSTIQATINGHELTVVFTENLGQVAVEVSSASGTSVHFSSNAQNKGVSVT